MGWYFGWDTLKGLKAEILKGWTNTDGPTKVTSTCLASCFRGQPAFSGTLWSVWEQTFTDGQGQQIKPPERFIKCDLLRCHAGDWGYKPLEESCGPCYWNCPEKYLGMVPVVANQEWRDAVAAYHLQRRLKLAQKRAAKNSS